MTVVRDWNEFLYRQYPPVELILDPWLPRRGLAMIAGFRGVGKTYFALSVAYSIATGGKFLGYEAAEPRSVLYVDGEMDPAELQHRFRQIDCAARRDRNGQPEKAKENLRILTHADQERGIPDLSDGGGTGRRIIREALGDSEVLILDNLSSLCRSGIENDSESWIVMQEWLISLRRQGKTVVIIHHAGKPDQEGNTRQRGTSKREDILNTSILLQPKRGEDIGKFSVKFTKVRGFAFPKPFDARLEIDEDCCRLIRGNGERVDTERNRKYVGKLLQQGCTQKEAAELSGLSVGTISKYANELGLARPHGGAREGAGRKRSIIEDEDE